MSLVGKVVGVVWQDIWWDPDEREIGAWADDDYIHLTYGLVLRDTDEWISLAHEWRPGKNQSCGTTSIFKPVIRSLKVYGDGTIESTDPGVQKKHRKSRSASQGRSRPAERSFPAAP